MLYHIFSNVHLDLLNNRFVLRHYIISKVIDFFTKAFYDISHQLNCSIELLGFILSYFLILKRVKSCLVNLFDHVNIYDNFILYKDLMNL